MRGRLTYCCLLVALLFAATLDASAQRYPERRATRQGTRLYERGDYAGAEQAYRRALELNPELREAAFNLGGAMFRQENGSGAAGVWAPLVADSIAGTETMAAASYNIGNTSLAGQQIDAAIEAYKQSLRLNPDDVEAKFNLAYAQKLKREQEQEQEQNDQNEDQNNGGGGGNDQNRDQDQDGDGQNDPQDGEGENDPQDGEGQNDPQEGDGNGDNGDPPPPSGQNRGEAAIDPRAAEQMLDAMQAAEDDTREKVNARREQAAPRSGKNW